MRLPLFSEGVFGASNFSMFLSKRLITSSHLRRSVPSTNVSTLAQTVLRIGSRAFKTLTITIQDLLPIYPCLSSGCPLHIGLSLEDRFFFGMRSLPMFERSPILARSRANSKSFLNLPSLWFGLSLGFISSAGGFRMYCVYLLFCVIFCVYLLFMYPY